jgi:hypothetical protein
VPLLQKGLVVMAVGLALSPTTMHAQSGTGIDHLVIGINRLDDAVTAFERQTGVRAVFGGQHPGVGTQNALASLGEGRYVELIAPVSASTLAHPVFGDLHKLARLTPVGWAVHTTDLASLVARLRREGFTVSDPQPGSRRRPDGSVLSWQSASVTGAGLALAPFFIQWGAGTPHPSATSPAGCRLVRVAVADPAPARLTTMLESLGLDIVPATGPRTLAFVLGCLHGEIRFE